MRAPAATAVLRLGDPRLRRVAAPLFSAAGGGGGVRADEAARQRAERLAASLFATLDASSDGVGLAAPQVGTPLRALVVSAAALLAPAPAPPSTAAAMTGAPATRQRVLRSVLFDPVITQRSHSQRFHAVEGCLSVPGLVGLVERFWRVELSFLDASLQRRRGVATGMLAALLQHEIDHLDGVVFTDRVRPRHLFVASEFEAHFDAVQLRELSRGCGDPFDPRLAFFEVSV